MSRSPVITTALLAFFSSLFMMVLLVFSGSQAQNPIQPTSLTGAYDQTDTRGEFHGIAQSSTPLRMNTVALQILGLEDQPKRIEVDLSKQRLYAFEGNTMVYNFLISSGKWYPTPTGTFHIWGKFKYTKMSGGNKALHTYYYLPNVPYVMFFNNNEIAASRGFSLHGTYWHENFGHPMSHGCINMKTEEAALIYNWSQPTVGGANSILASKEDPGTEVSIYGTAPRD